MDFNTAKGELNTLLGDSNNVTFTDEEKTRALTKAWNDPFVVKTVLDDSLTYTQGVYSYERPATLSTVKDIYVSLDNQPPAPISNGLWEEIDNHIYFNQLANRILTTGTTLLIKGNHKMAIGDSIDMVDMQEYVISLAGCNTLAMLAHKKANLFVKNDITMAELLALKNQLTVDVKEARAHLAKSFESI